jgi:hypothetical protein
VIGSHERTLAFVNIGDAVQSADRRWFRRSEGRNPALAGFELDDTLVKRGASKCGTRRKEPNLCRKKIDAIG